MSNPDPLPADNEQQQPIPTLIPSDTEDPPATPDPLLGSGSFIDPTNNGAPNHTHTHTHTASKEENNTPSNEPQQKTASKEPITSDDLIHKYPRPSWLPDDWQMILKKRTSGATEGTVDRYYIAPSGQRLRSKNEVVNFLATGSKRKKPSTPSSDDATAKGSTPGTAKGSKSGTAKGSKSGTAKGSEGSAPETKKKKTSARKKVHAAFDFKNPPEKVSWCLTYATDDVWSPSIGDWSIPLATKQEWGAVFNNVSQS